MRITKTFIDKLGPPPIASNGRASQAFYRDSAIPGFALRITSAGAKAFIIERRINGKVKRVTLGKYGNLTVEQARQEAMKFLGSVAIGKDPVAEAKAKRVRKITLNEVFADYLNSREDLKPTTRHDYSRGIHKYLEDWAFKPIAEISKDMVEIRHQELGKRSKARANNTMRVLRALFNYAMSKYEDSKGKPIIETNPVDRLSQTRAWFNIERRQTVIKAHQLKDWYEATLQLERDTTRDYLYLLLFTGLRKTEAAKLTWDNVDFKEKSITFKETKNKQMHILPLSDFLYDLLKGRSEIKSSPYVFPAESVSGHLVEPKKAVDRVAKLSGVPFTPHDLRRTFITIAESLDIPAYALKRLLNHKDSQDVTAGYIVPDINRLRRPMDKISNFLLSQMKLI